MAVYENTRSRSQVSKAKSIFAQALAAALVGWVMTTFSLSAAIAATQSTEVTTRSGARVHVEIDHGSPGKAVFVLLNGLIYDLDRWDPLVESLAAKGHTVIRYAFSAQTESLKLLPPNQEPHFFRTGLDLTAMTEELGDVLDALEIEERVHLVGLSYGATVAADFAARRPERVEAAIFISPLVIPLDYYDPSGQYLRAWLNTIRFWENTPCYFYGMMVPGLCTARDYWYDAFYNSLFEPYLTNRVKSVPEGVDPAIYKKSVFHLVRAARDFDLRAYAPGLTNVHFLVASDDDPALRLDQEHAWREVSELQKRSYFVFKGARHALPDVAPLRTVDVLAEIADKHPRTQNGEKIEIPADR